MNRKISYQELEQRVRILERNLSSYKSSYESNQLDPHYLEAILNNINMPVFLKGVDYNYIFINNQFEVLSGVSNSDAQGKNDFDIFSISVAQLFRSQDEEVVKQQKLIEFEETVELQDGVHSFITAKFPLFNREGIVDGISGVCADITERKKAEAELKEAEEKYRGIFEHSPLGILQIDTDGIITASNKKLAEIIGVSLRKIVGFDLLQSIQDESVRAATVSVLSGQIAYHEGNFKFDKTKGNVYLRGVFAPVSSKDGTITAAIGIIEDITKKKEAEEALKKAHDELEQRVAERTAELDIKTERLMETNAALNVLLEKREEDRKELEEKVMFNVEKLLYPYLEKLRQSHTQESQEALITIIRTNLEEITAPFAQKYKSYLANLTPTQLHIADFIKQGLTTKEIAQLLSLSPATIACHRQEIRKRLALNNTKINLQVALTANT